MAENIKKHWDIILVGGIGLTLAILGVLVISGMVVLPKLVSATTTQDVAVTATVEAWLSFTVSPTSVTLTPSMVDAAGGTRVASSTAVGLNIGTNAANGWSVTIRGKYGGICHTSATNTVCASPAENLIASVPTSATSTLTAGMSPGRYGANATSATTTVSIGSFYNFWATTTVGAIATTTQTLASKSTPNPLGAVANLRIYAAAPSTQKSGSYIDTVTLTATPGI